MMRGHVMKHGRNAARVRPWKSGVGGRRWAHTTVSGVVADQWVRTDVLDQMADESAIDWSGWRGRSPLRSGEMGLWVVRDFVSEEQEGVFVRELDPVLTPKRYQLRHWDGVIRRYREMERARSEWKDAMCGEVLDRMQALAQDHVEWLPGVHVLDLDGAGCIKHHVDSYKFSGGIVSGVCLESDAVMRFAVDADSVKGLDADAAQALGFVDVWLPRRCLYMITALCRYAFGHSVLEVDPHTGGSSFGARIVPRTRRVSIISRDVRRIEPPPLEACHFSPQP